MTRDELIETMARAICESIHEGGDWGMQGVDAWESRESARDCFRKNATAALTAIEAASYAVVPTTPTDRQLAAMETGSSMATVYELALAHSPIRGK